MRNRIIAVTCGIILALVGLPALPAQAATTGTTCANATMDSPTPALAVLAHACISWKDAPDGTKWTMTDQRIWNPPSAPNYPILEKMWDNTGHRSCSTYLTSDQTQICPLWNDPVVGAYTAKFEVLVEAVSSIPWCIYLIPRDYNVAHHACT